MLHVEMKRVVLSSIYNAQSEGFWRVLVLNTVISCVAEQHKLSFLDDFALLSACGVTVFPMDLEFKGSL